MENGGIGCERGARAAVGRGDELSMLSTLSSGRISQASMNLAAAVVHIISENQALARENAYLRERVAEEEARSRV